MPPSPTSRTRLGALLARRGWSVSRFTREYQKTAAALNIGNGYLDERTAKRWIAGQVTNPRVPAAAVLHAMFDADVATLFEPPLPPPPRDPDLGQHRGLVPAARAGDDGNSPTTPGEEASSTDRRDLLTAGVVLTAGGLTGSPAERAARISRAIDASTPDTLTLAQLEHGLYQVVSLYDTTPLDTLAEPIEGAWDRAETLLDTCRSGASRRDLERLTGWYAYYNGRVAHERNGDEQESLAFLVLAAKHAEAAGDTLLSGAVADMRAALAFFAGRFTAAATIAHQALPAAHPYVLPSLASQLARAQARTGDADGALAALRIMGDSIWCGEHLPGPPPADEEAYEAYSGITLGYLGRGDDAERHARRSLTLLTESGRHLQLVGSHLALARAFFHRPEPDPEQAAIALTDALTTAEGNGHGRTAQRAANLYRRLTADPDWARLPAVRDLADRLPTRRALPPSAAV